MNNDDVPICLLKPMCDIKIFGCVFQLLLYTPSHIFLIIDRRPDHDKLNIAQVDSVLLLGKSISIDPISLIVKKRLRIKLQQKKN